ncbi:hypothetical protein BDY21DRAFT_381317, partial [Lineolata rhizophorae]
MRVKRRGRGRGGRFAAPARTDANNHHNADDIADGVSKKITRSSSNISSGLANPSGKSFAEVAHVKSTAPILTIAGLEPEFLENLVDASTPQSDAELKYNMSKSSGASVVSDENYVAKASFQSVDGNTRDSDANFSPDKEPGREPQPAIRGSRSRAGRRSGRGRGRGRWATPNSSLHQDRQDPSSPLPTMGEPELADGQALLPKEEEPLPIEAGPRSIEPSTQDTFNSENSPSKQLHAESNNVATNADIIKEAPTTPAMTPEISQSREYIEESLTDADLPPAFGSRGSTPSESEFEDQAAFLLHTRFPPMTDPQEFVSSLTKHPPCERTTENLYQLALNTQRALVAWQDEFLKLDARTAPHAHPPKKPATGGRQTMDLEMWEAMKQADLYNYTFDPKKAPGQQDPFAQRIGDSGSGRELRQRRARDVSEIVGNNTSISETDEPANSQVPRSLSGLSRRGRRTAAPSRYDSVVYAPTRQKRSFAASETPDPETAAPPAKRGRGGRGGGLGRGASHLPSRVREVRAESTVSPSGFQVGDPAAATSTHATFDPTNPHHASTSMAGNQEAESQSAHQSMEPAATQAQQPPSPDHARESTDFPGMRRRKQIIYFGPERHVPHPPLRQSQKRVQGLQMRPQDHEYVSPFANAAHIRHQSSPADAASASPNVSNARTHPTIVPLPALPPYNPPQPKVPIPMQSMQQPTRVKFATPALPQKRKQRVKSEKRSASMTKWWAERKSKEGGGNASRAGTPAGSGAPTAAVPTSTVSDGSGNMAGESASGTTAAAPTSRATPVVTPA